MSRKFMTLAGVFFMLLVGFAWFSVADAVVYSSISGHVIAEDTGKGVPGMTIVLMHGEWEKGIKTDANGFYIFDDLVPGKYKLFFDSMSIIKTNYYVKNGKILIQISPGKNIMNQNFILSVGGAISGQVYQNDGTTPYSGSDIAVEIWDRNTGKRITLSGANPDGSFFIQGIRPTDNAVVEINPTGYYSTQQKNIQIVKGQTTSSVNFILPPSDTGITGTVIDADTNTPIQHATIAIYNSSGSILTTTGSDVNGNYKIFGLSPGIYTLDVTTGIHQIATSPPITVINKQVTTYNFSLKKKEISLNDFMNRLKKIALFFWNLMEPPDAEAFDFEHCRKIDALGKNGCADPSCDSNFKQISDSFGSAMQTLYNNSCLPSDMRNTVEAELNNLKEIPITCEDSCEPDPLAGGYLCAYRDPDLNLINICPRSFTYNPAEPRNCTTQCLQSTLFHETLHFGIHSHVRVGPCTRACFSDCARSVAAGQEIDPTCCTDPDKIKDCCFATNWACNINPLSELLQDQPQPNPCTSGITWCGRACPNRTGGDWKGATW